MIVVVTIRRGLERRGYLVRRVIPCAGRVEGACAAPTPLVQDQTWLRLRGTRNQHERQQRLQKSQKNAVRNHGAGRFTLRNYLALRLNGC